MLPYHRIIIVRILLFCLYNDSSLCREAPLFAKEHKKLPLSEVRPLMEDGQDRNLEDKTTVSPGRTEEPE